MNKAYYKEFACIKLAFLVFILDFWENGRSKNESGRSFLLNVRSNDHSNSNLLELLEWPQCKIHFLICLDSHFRPD